MFDAGNLEHKSPDGLFFVKPEDSTVIVCGKMPAAALLRAGANDPCWHQPADANAAFVPVRQALAAHGSTGSLARSVARCRTPAEFRRWMKRSLAQAGSEELPLLNAYLRYFETLAASH